MSSLSTHLRFFLNFFFGRGGVENCILIIGGVGLVKTQFVVETDFQTSVGQGEGV